MRTPRTPILPSLLLTLCAAPACADDLDAELSDDDAPVMTRAGDDLSPPPYATPGQWTHDEPTCGERARELVAEFGILPPKAPSLYNAPDPEVLCDGLDPDDCPVKSVSTTTELVAAVSGPYTGPLDIILNDGIYQANELPGAEDGVAYLTLNGAHRLWAKSAAGAVLTFGIYAGGNPGAVVDPDDLTDPVVARFYGPEFHGLVFDVPDRRRCLSARSTPRTPRTSTAPTFSHVRRDIIFHGPRRRGSARPPDPRATHRRPRSAPPVCTATHVTFKDGDRRPAFVGENARGYTPPPCPA